MSIKNEDLKKSSQINVTDARTGEITKVVHLKETQVGLTSDPKNHTVTGNSTVVGTLTATSGSVGTLVVTNFLSGSRLFGPTSFVPIVAGGRLTLTTGVPITGSNVVSGTVLYYTPYESGQITLFNGTSWQLCSFTEKSISLAGSVINKNYDVFATFATGDVSLESLVWTNDTTRATAITTQNGIKVKSGDATRRFLGTFRTTSATTTEDSTSKRLVWNYHNRFPRTMTVTDATAGWTYAVTTTWRQARGSTANKVECVTGDETHVEATVMQMISNTGASHTRVGVGIDSTTVNSAQLCVGYSAGASAITLAHAHFRGLVKSGYHAINWIEWTENATATFYNQSSVRDPGLLAVMFG